MSEITDKILHFISKKSYTPLTPKALARKLELEQPAYREFKAALRKLVREGKAQLGKNDVIRPAESHPKVRGTYQRTGKGEGVVRVPGEEGTRPSEYQVPDHLAHDAAHGDEVEIAVRRRSGRSMEGMAEIKEVVRRATRQFVGTYFERDGSSLVRVDGQVFAHSVGVADAGTKNAKPNDKVVVEMIRFPTAMDRGEGVVIEVLGKSGDPRVDTMAIVRSLGVPEEFPEEALDEAHRVAEAFNESDLSGRTDFTGQLTITIDPIDAKDFDDAVSLTRDAKTGHWVLMVHIADVSAFVPAGGPLDLAARERGTSVYLPQRVIPMFPEVISNGIASLQEGKVRYVKSVEIELTEAGEPVATRFFNGAIRNRKRFAYEQVQEILEGNEGNTDPEIVRMLNDMRSLSHTMRARRSKRGALELSMPEAVLEYDDKGHVSGAHFAVNNDSHRLIEDFMLAANEAVASHFDHHKVPFLRRVHPAPSPKKLTAFSEFARSLDYKLPVRPSRFDLQHILELSANKPERQAIHYAMLRSLKQATYSPEQDEHFALASDHYCHFTSPIRRYPDLTVHRQIGQWIERQRVKVDMGELRNLGEHCSKTERRAETAERESVKMRLLLYVSSRIGMELDAVITGVAEYGFFAQGKTFPVEGLIHIASLADDYFHFDAEGHSLIGKRTRARYRLGDEVRVEVLRVDLQRKQLDLRVAGRPTFKKRH